MRNPLLIKQVWWLEAAQIKVYDNMADRATFFDTPHVTSPSVNTTYQQGVSTKQAPWPTSGPGA
jgi:hypothetical protein